MAGGCNGWPAAPQLTLDAFVKAGFAFVAAIVVAMIITIFLKETGSVARQVPASPAPYPTNPKEQNP